MGVAWGNLGERVYHLETESWYTTRTFAKDSQLRSRAEEFIEII